MKLKTTLTALTLTAILGAAFTVALPAGAQERGMAPWAGSEMPAFDTLDADKDGKVTPSEMAAFRAATITGSDTNADGKLSAEELAAQEVRRLTERAATRSQRMVQILDVDGDSLLSVEELAAGPGPVRMFERMDGDGDGAISAAEAETALAEMQDRHGGDGKGGKRRHGRHHGGDGAGMGMN